MVKNRFLAGTGFIVLAALIVIAVVQNYSSAKISSVVPAQHQTTGWRDAGAVVRNANLGAIPVTGNSTSAGKAADIQNANDVGVHLRILHEQYGGWRDTGAGGR